MEEITPARLGIDNDGNLYADDFKDYYHSKLSAVAESRYVFLAGNHLPENWQSTERFTLAELGFGSGLNFLITGSEWVKYRQDGQRLHYIAIEKHPLQPEHLRTLLMQYPELARYAQELLENYPPLLTGVHTLVLAGGSVSLTLYFMDVSTALAEMVAAVDCWYLDGFSPARNPAMWSAARMQQLAALSRPGKTTLATFTAASAVRRNLQSAGFVVTKRKGFGGKREMLTAVYPASASPLITLQPWHSLPVKTSDAFKQRTAIIIGGGVAGCQSARALAERGWTVRLLERHPQLAQEASGNKAGVLIPKMTARPDWGERFYRQAFLYAYRQLCRLHQAHADLQWSPCGAVQLNHSEREAKRWEVLKERRLPEDFIQLLEAAPLSEVAGLAMPSGGSYFPQGGWVNPQSLCDVLVRHGNITVLSDTTALRLERVGQQWQVVGECAELSPADVVVIASGKDIAPLTEAVSLTLPFMWVRGQTSAAPTTAITAALKTTIGHEGYITPGLNGRHFFGATFERGVQDVGLSPASDQQNYGQLQNHLPALAAQLQVVDSSHAAIRMTTPDRYPYVGPLPDAAYYLRAYEGLRQGKLRQTYPEAAYIPGIYIMGGFGSRGLTTSALCAGLLVSLLNREPLPIEKSLYYKLQPSRFLMRQIRQNRH